jgi:hypothetical protein
MVTHYGALFAEVPIRSKLGGHLTVQEQRIFSAEGLKVVPIFTKTQATLSGRSANEQRARPPFSHFSSRRSTGNDADLDQATTIDVDGLESPCMLPHDEIWLTLEHGIPF